MLFLKRRDRAEGSCNLLFDPLRQTRPPTGFERDRGPIALTISRKRETPLYVLFLLYHEARYWFVEVQLLLLGWLALL